MTEFGTHTYNFSALWYTAWGSGIFIHKSLQEWWSHSSSTRNHSYLKEGVWQPSLYSTEVYTPIFAGETNYMLLLVGTKKIQRSPYSRLPCNTELAERVDSVYCWLHIPPGWQTWLPTAMTTPQVDLCSPAVLCVQHGYSSPSLSFWREQLWPLFLCCPFHNRPVIAVRCPRQQLGS